MARTKLSSYNYVPIVGLVQTSHSFRVYSSFWAPLFDPRIVNYRVDAQFFPDSGRNARADYERMYGPSGANLIADLGNGKGLRQYSKDKKLGDVIFYYTYPGAPT
nr:uncharacterized protein LOC128680926 isoform X2 [Plodia interpunctella]